MLIRLFIRNYAADSSLGICYIAFVSWNQVQVNVEYALARSSPYIHSHIISVRMESFIQYGFYFVCQREHSGLFIHCQVKKRINVASRHDECVAFRYGVPVKKCKTKFIAGDNTLRRQVAKWTVDHIKQYLSKA